MDRIEPPESQDSEPANPLEILALRLPRERETCPYLAGRQAEFEHYLFQNCGAEAFCHVIEAGFRHFGAYTFRPACPGDGPEGVCGACVPLRVRVGDFSPSRSQRRVLRKGQGVTFALDRPRATDEKHRIYLEHKKRFQSPHGRAGGECEGEGSGGELSREGFDQVFYAGGEFTWECTYRLDGQLVGAGLIDIAPRVLSSIYFYFDPRFEALSPGTLSLLNEIAIAERLGIPYAYLGYTVYGNHALRYKMDFRPCEFYDGRAWRALREGKEFLLDPARIRTGPYQPLGC